MSKSMDKVFIGISVVAQLNAMFLTALKEIGFNDEQAIKLCTEKGIKLGVI